MDSIQNSSTSLLLIEPFSFKIASVMGCKGVPEDLTVMTCHLCRPKPVSILCDTGQHGKHVECKHPQHLEKYIQLWSQVQKRKLQSPEIATSPAKQPKLTDVNYKYKQFSQPAVDRLMLKFVSQGLLPFEIVELPAFKELLHELQPTVQVFSNTSFRRKLSEAVEGMKNNIITAMSGVEYIAATTDCWSAMGRNFIGYTAQWIDSESLERRSAALACRCLKGSHTFDVLACAINEIHSSYNIRDKVVRTTTDNGSNFFKALTDFGSKSKKTIDESSEEIGTELTCSSTVEESEDEEGDGILYREVSAILDMEISLEYKLPNHHCCACHLLHLTATTDAMKAERNDTYKNLYCSSFAKCQAMWNKVGRSVLAAETEEDNCKLQLIESSQMRWNSLYLAVEGIVKIIKKQGEGPLRDVCATLKIKMLNPVELDFLKEYSLVMKPVASALKILQAETNAYMGCLLPTLYELLRKLGGLNLTYCTPLVSAVKDGVMKRFGHMLHDVELISAAILLPKFKTKWASDDVTLKGLEYIKNKMISTGEEDLLNSSSSEGDDFFSFLNSHQSRGSGELEGYLENSSTSIQTLKAYPFLMKLSLLLNTPLPASAACEQLFKRPGQIFSPERAIVSNKDFENQVLLKLNEKYVNF